MYMRSIIWLSRLMKDAENVCQIINVIRDKYYKAIKDLLRNFSASSKPTINTFLLV